MWTDSSIRRKKKHLPSRGSNLDLSIAGWTLWPPSYEATTGTACELFVFHQALSSCFFFEKKKQWEQKTLQIAICYVKMDPKRMKNAHLNISNSKVFRGSTLDPLPQSGEGKPWLLCTCPRTPPPPPSPRGSKGQASPLLFKKLNHAALVCVCVCLSVSLSVSQWKEINSWKSPPQYIQNQFPWPIRSTGIHFISEIRSIAYSEIPSIKHSEILSIKHSEITSIAHSEILSIKHSEIPSIAHSASSSNPSVEVPNLVATYARVLISTPFIFLFFSRLSLVFFLYFFLVARYARVITTRLSCLERTVWKQWLVFAHCSLKFPMPLSCELTSIRNN